MLRSIFVRGLWGLALAVASAASSADEYSGRLDDPTNAALVGSDLGVALFGDEYEVALNVALYHLVVGDAGTLTFTSTGFSAGGVDPYFTLFAGSGTGATFAGSNYDHASRSAPTDGATADVRPAVTLPLGIRAEDAVVSQAGVVSVIRAQPGAALASPGGGVAYGAAATPERPATALASR